MKKNTFVKILIIVCLAVAIMIAACACTPENDLLFAENGVIGRFSDGMEVLDILPTPIDATQYIDLPRVSKKFYIDNRVEGLHLTGLYLPSGEKLEIKIAESVAHKSHKVVVNANSANEEIFALSKTSNEITSQKGGIVDIYINSNDKELNSFEIVVNGAVESPYYRYGIDKFEGEDTKLQGVSANKDFLAVLDCANIRFYIPSNKIVNTTKIFNTLSWWRNSVELVNEINGMSFANGFNSPLLVYFGDGIDKDNVIFAPESLIDDTITYDQLLVGKAQPLMDKITYQKAKERGKFADDDMRATYAKIVSLVANISFSDCKSLQNDELKKFANGVENINFVEKNMLSKNEQIQSFVIDILHSFGLENAVKILSLNAQSPNITTNLAIDDLAQKCVDILAIDARDSMKYFGIDMSVEQAKKLETLATEGKIKKYVPVHTQYTFGQVDKKTQLGNIVPFGRTTQFDFESAIVSPQKGWRVVALNGGLGVWKEVKNGVFNYTPVKDALVDYFQITLNNGTMDVTLKGKITVDIKTANYEVYDNVVFRQVDEAIKEYKKSASVTEKTSLDGAIIPKTKIEEQVNDYCFYVTTGSFQVAETAKYTLYLKSSGLCRVDFGVPMAMSKAIESFGLTVNEYTKELSKEVSLQKDVIYHFAIYDLSIKGGAWAGLGIAKGDDQPRNIPKDMLIFSGYSLEDNYVYVEPKVKIDGFDKTSAIDIEYKNSDFDIAEISNMGDALKKETLLDNDSTSGIVSHNENLKYDIFVVNKFNHTFNNIKLLLGDTVFASGKEVFCNVAVSDDGEKYNNLNKIVLKKGESIYQVYANPNNKFVKLTFSSSASFQLEAFDIAFARKFAETTIVPNTSSAIEYRGLWTREHKYLSLNGSVNQSDEKNCAASFNFYGDAIAIFATKGNGFGKARVEVDGEKFVIDLSSESIVCNSMVFSRSFAEAGKHNVKILPYEKDIINIDYIGYVPHKEPVHDKINNGKLVFIIVIPSIVLIATLLFLLIDIMDKARKRKLKFVGVANDKLPKTKLAKEKAKQSVELSNKQNKKDSAIDKLSKENIASKIDKKIVVNDSNIEKMIDGEKCKKNIPLPEPTKHTLEVDELKIDNDRDKKSNKKSKIEKEKNKK